MKDEGWGQSSKVYCEKCGTWSLATCQSSIFMTCGSQEVKFHTAKSFESNNKITEEGNRGTSA